MMVLPRVLEWILFIFGSLFNRGLIILSVFASGIIASFYPQLVALRMASMVPAASAVRVFIAFNIVQIVVLFLITASLKLIIRRQRPLFATNLRHMAPKDAPPRYYDLTLRENGTFAMPSGDTT